MSNLITSLESIQILIAMEKYASNNEISKSAVTLGKVAVDSICTLNNIKDIPTLEDMAAVNMEPVINSLFEKISKDSTELLLDLLKRINNRKKTITDLEVDLVKLSDIVNYLSKESLPLIANIKPDNDFFYLFNQDGINIPQLIKDLKYFQTNFIEKTDVLLLNIIRYIYSELLYTSDKLTNNFTLLHSDIPEDYNGNIFGLSNLIYKDTFGDNLCLYNYDALDALKNIDISIVELTNNPLKIELSTQSKMNNEQWLEFNSQPRSNKDITVIPITTIEEANNYLIELAQQLSAVNEEVNKIILTAFASSEFTDVVNRMIHLSQDNFGSKEQFLYELFVSAINIYQKTDDVIMNMCINYFYALNSYLNKTFNLYNYK